MTTSDPLRPRAIRCPATGPGAAPVAPREAPGGGAPPAVGRAVWIVVLLAASTALGAGKPKRAKAHPPAAPAVLVLKTLTPDRSWVMVEQGDTAATEVLTVPGDPQMSAFHLPGDGKVLFSVDVPTDLPAAGGRTYYAFEVVRYDDLSGNFSPVLCQLSPATLEPRAVDIDPLFQTATGSLVVSFGSPTTIGAVTYMPSDLVELESTGPGCADWAVAQSSNWPAGKFFDAKGAGLPLGANLTGAAVDPRTGVLVVRFDYSVKIGSDDYLPGELASWDGIRFARYRPPPEPGPLKPGTIRDFDLGSVPGAWCAPSGSNGASGRSSTSSAMPRSR